jgi:hypothetical protein
MPDRRGSRFILEVLFLLGLAVALTLAKLDAIEIAAVMVLGWLIVAALEWAAWRGEPHYGSGLPPRYYVPNMNLPPAQPLEQVQAGYPEAHRDEAPTWIASPALRAEVLGAHEQGGEAAAEWPQAAPVPVGADPEPAKQGETQEDPWTIVSLPTAPLGEVEPDPGPEPEPEPEPSLEVAPARSARGIARYSLDPLGDPPPRRRFGRGGVETPPAVEVPARPAGVRALPGRSNRQD